MATPATRITPPGTSLSCFSSGWLTRVQNVQGANVTTTELVAGHEISRK